MSERVGSMRERVGPGESPPVRELILASAGSGKTFRIVSRIIGLLAHGEPPESIFATTFTRKAAGEILGRVLVRLAAASLDDEAAAELASHASFDADAPVTLDAERCRALLRDLVQRLHRLNIGTLDAFFVRGAQSFAHEIGLPPGWSIADAPTASRALTEALQEVLRRGDTGAIVELVRLAQRGEAHRSVHSALLKRLEVLHTIHHQLDPSAPDPYSIFPGLADESLPDPAGSSRLRIAEAIAAIEPPRTRSGTPVRHWANGLSNAADAIRAGDWERFIGLTLTQRILTGQAEFSGHEIDEEVAAVFEEAIEEAARAIGARYQSQGAALGRLVALFDDALETVQRRFGAYRFEDLTRLLGGPAPLGARSDLHYRLDAGMRHLLLDEFQDTSLTQWTALRPVADALLGDSGAAIFVGDPKQSIYGWRGAEPALVERVSERYDLPRELLARSWRSSQVVLDVVNEVFEGIESSPVLAEEHDRATAAEWARSFSRHVAQHDMPGYVRIVVGPDTDSPRAQHRPDQLAYAARMVRDLLESAPGFGIGVLTRENKAVARIIHELKLLGIAASEEGGNPLTDAASVVSVLALLRLADHPDDRIARYTVARTPVGALVDFTDPSDDRAARRLAHRVRGQLLVDGYGATIGAWAEALEPACTPREARRLRQLVELAFRHEPQATLRAMDFIRWVETERVEDPTTAEVRVMTIHQAKGLEFDIVVLPELDGQIFHGRSPEALPYRAAPGEPFTRVFPYVKDAYRKLFPEIEEAHRQYRASVLRDALSTLYVAMTRARHALHIVIMPDGKTGPGGGIRPSRFVREALAPDQPAEPFDDDFFSAGDPEWMKAVTREKARARPAARTTSAPRAPLFRATGRRARMLAHRTPSGLIGAGPIDLAQRLSLHPGTSLERGSVVHAWCEEIEWLDDGLPDRDELRRIARRVGPGLPSEEVDALIDRFHAWVRQPAIASALSRTGYPAGAVVERERPFVHRSGDAIVEGIIDRLVLWNDGAEIIDYKSDDVAPDDHAKLEERTILYAPQLRAYRAAVAGIFGLPEEAVHAKLMFLRAGAVRTVDGT